ncbi:MAG: DUF4105 domain-containing protein [Bacteroidaceae bacterium]|nr:DUF4105 domain-containing protein [Bacteroidaceae bacterium]
MKRLFFFIVALATFVWGEAQTEEAASSEPQIDSLYVSLLTCAPGADAYKLFGHTAIRVKGEGEKSFDFAFNYGMFNYQKKNFVYRFVRGETDYELGAEPTDFFFSRYSEEGIEIDEQVLNLTDEEKKLLYNLLVINYQPENRVYRYNFLYDNCTTRARDIIRGALLDRKLRYKNRGKEYEETTFREILHRFTKGSPWTAFGIDMILGSEVDKKRSQMEQMFIPSVYEMEVGDAVLAADSTQMAFVKSVKHHAPTGKFQEVAGFPMGPVTLFWIVFGIAAGLSVVDFIRRKATIWFDIVLLLAQGLAGCLIAFLFFFSEHPAVGSNWLILAFNPLVLGMIPVVLVGKKVKKVTCEIVNMSVLVFTLLLFWLSLQWLHPAMLPLVLTLLVRSALRLRTFMIELVHRKY